ncbi:hypothetical protein GYMLUDRAFT_672009 [Collybiopsis luxurians FD-317 M1]|uniref:Unplaced genomic scaffold GYMLUscaffold_31, whole genome shotgun sequence n=1 Tax=Collybiopsis luxurians FD-317 M1 TaxID=944289 RepID=A0A0D0CLX0_9AGAR|nr:hypothetical protein GYMLUDRAFT_672009 [Collybiopsis luxurians FD-317 M1]
MSVQEQPHIITTNTDSTSEPLHEAHIAVDMSHDQSPHYADDTSKGKEAAHPIEAQNSKPEHPTKQKKDNEESRLFGIPPYQSSYTGRHLF